MSSVNTSPNSHTIPSALKSTAQYKRKISQANTQKISENTISEGVFWFELVMSSLLGILWLGFSIIHFESWTYPWTLPKTIVFIIGTGIFTGISFVFWLFGHVKTVLRITLFDILIILFGGYISIQGFVIGNSLLYGDISQIGTMGLMMGYAILLYSIIRITLQVSNIQKIVYVIGCTLLINTIGVVLFSNIPLFSQTLSWFTRFSPTFSFLSNSPQELLLISLLGVVILFEYVMKSQRFQVVYYSLYIIGLIFHSIMASQIPFVPFQILTIVIIIIHMVLWVQHSLRNNQSPLSIIRTTFLFSLLILGLIFLMVVQPLGQFVLDNQLSYQTSFNLISEAISPKNILFGFGNSIDAWNLHAPESVNITPFWNVQFTHLTSYPLTLFIQSGLLGLSLYLLIIIWFIFSIIRILLTGQRFGYESLIGIVILLGLLWISLTPIILVLAIFSFSYWSSQFSQKFYPILKTSLDVSTLPVQISSMFTMVGVGLLAGILVTVIPIIGVIRAENQLVLSQGIDSKEEYIAILEQVSEFSPDFYAYQIPYLNVQVQEFSQKSFVLSNANTEPNQDQLDMLQNDIINLQNFHKQLERKFPNNSSRVQSQIELYLLIKQYGGTVNEAEFMALIEKGKEISPRSPYWEYYMAQYYFFDLQSQKDLTNDQQKTLNDSVRESLDNSLQKKKDFVPSYQVYYGLLAINRDYLQQVELLKRYISSTVDINVDMVILLVQSYRNLKQYTEAIDLMRSVLESYPDKSQYYELLGDIYVLNNNDDDALEVYQKARELNPNNSEILEKIKNLN